MNIDYLLMSLRSVYFSFPASKPPKLPSFFFSAFRIPHSDF